MRRHEGTGPVIVSLLAFTVVMVTVTACGTTEMRPTSSVAPAATDATLSNSRRMVEEGRRTFRFDTFGSEAFWGDAIKLHQALAGNKHGGVGGGVSPKTALAVGLKVDSEALPASLADQIKKGAVNLDDAATTLVLLKLDAVVGVKGLFDDRGALRSMGIKGLWTHQQGGFYHDGRFAGLREVVDHYNGHFGLGLTDADVKDLGEHLKSL